MSRATGLELQRPHADCGRCAHQLSWECVDCGRNRGGTQDRFEPRDGEQSSTSDEREIDRLRLEVSALTSQADAREAEVARLRRLVTGAADAIDGLLSDVAALGLQMHPRVASHLRELAHLIRAMLDQGATR